jgi:hypothetical protein
MVVVLGNSYGFRCLDFLSNQFLFGYCFNYLLMGSLSGLDDDGLWSFHNYHFLMFHFEWSFYSYSIGFFKEHYLFFWDDKGLLVDNMCFLKIQIMIDRFFFNVSSSDNILFFYLNDMKLWLFHNDSLAGQFNDLFLFLDERGLDLFDFYCLFLDLD